MNKAGCYKKTIKMKYGLMLFFVAVLSYANSQTVEKYYNYQWKPCSPAEARFYSTIVKTDSGYNRKDYFIHEQSLQMAGKYADQDCKIANGHFRYFHSNRNLESEGKYINGNRDGLWLRFHSTGGMHDSTTYRLGEIKGTSLAWHTNGYMSDSTSLNEDGSGVNVTWFENGMPSSAGLYSIGKKQHGKWQYFHNNGKASSIESFNEGRLIGKTYFDEDGKEQKDTANQDKSPTFPGGISAWLQYLSKKAYFPDQYKIVNADKAVVVVTFAINEEGRVTDAVVSTPFFPQFDKIALSAISRSPKWKPAISHNRKIKMWLRQPVTFSQEGE